jgi:hypothetical protein
MFQQISRDCFCFSAGFQNGIIPAHLRDSFFYFDIWGAVQLTSIISQSKGIPLCSEMAFEENIGCIFYDSMQRS